MLGAKGRAANKRDKNTCQIKNDILGGEEKVVKQDLNDEKKLS